VLLALVHCRPHAGNADPARVREDSGLDGIGDLQAGDAFWIVGDKPAKNFDDFASRILADFERQQKKSDRSPEVRVVYDFQRATFAAVSSVILSANLL